MGVSGCGKSSLGARLAQSLGVDFVEGDALHPPGNVRRMAAGIALTDVDRADWLAALSQCLAEAYRGQRGLVLSCSALKRSYRDVLRAGAPDLRLIHLHGSPALLAERLEQRSGHYMPATLLPSQLDALEPPDASEGALGFDIARPLADIAAAALQALKARTSSPMTHFTQIELYTDSDGRARFREHKVPLDEGTPQAQLSALRPSGGLQLRQSPPGFRSEFHCTTTPQWVFILTGQMEIGLQDGSSRIFAPGQHFYSNDTLPAGAEFNTTLHGHRSRQLGPDALVTAFVRG